MTKESEAYFSFIGVNEDTKIEVNTDSSTMKIIDSKKEDKFAIVIIGVVDEEGVFYWGDTTDILSEYARSESSGIRKMIEHLELFETQHYAIDITDPANEMALDAFERDGSYIIDDEDVMLSRFSVEQVMALIHGHTDLKCMCNVTDGLSIHFGIRSRVS